MGYNEADNDELTEDDRRANMFLTYMGEDRGA